jgi:hypothetical protein
MLKLLKASAQTQTVKKRLHGEHSVAITTIPSLQYLSLNHLMQTTKTEKYNQSTFKILKLDTITNSTASWTTDGTDSTLVKNVSRDSQLWLRLILTTPLE